MYWSRISSSELMLPIDISSIELINRSCSLKEQLLVHDQVGIWLRDDVVPMLDEPDAYEGLLRLV